jgi:hypothetical protein
MVSAEYPVDIEATSVTSNGPAAPTRSDSQLAIGATESPSAVSSPFATTTRFYR